MFSIFSSGNHKGDFKGMLYIEFSRLQNWMIFVKDNNPEAYEVMYDRDIELKITLSSPG